MLPIWLLGLFLTVAPLGRVAAGAEYEEKDVVHGGDIVGHVIYRGERASGTVRPTRDRDVCGAEPRSDGSITVEPSGGLASAVVSVDGMTSGKSRQDVPDAMLEITACEFRPRVLSVTFGQKLVVRNVDGILHRPRGTIDESVVFQWGMPLSQRLPKKIREVGLIAVRCQEHPWSRAWVAAFEHPYHTVTEPDGSYHITDVPPGAYVLRVYHEILGERTVDVTVAPNATTTRKITYE